MNKLVWLFLFWLLLAFSNLLQANTLQTSKQTMTEKIALFIAVQDNLRSQADINALAEQVSAQFKYYHAQYNLILDKSAWLLALQGRLDNQKTRNIKTKISHISYGLNAAFVTQSSHWEQRVKDKWYARSSDEIVTLFEFEGNKISIVREYW